MIYSGTVENCNFTNNTASEQGGAIMIYSGTVENCNFTNNTASEQGGAIMIYSGTVENCNFTNNTASEQGGAIKMNSGTVKNCNFTNNSADRGGAVLSQQYLGVTVDTCVLKTSSDTTFNTKNIPPTLTVDDFTTSYGSADKISFDLKTSSSVPIYDANISISLYFKNNDSWVGDYSCLSGEEWAVDLPVGSYYAIYKTEYAGFEPINKTITITVPEIQYYINVTSSAGNNKTVNITAKTNIPEHLFWDGKLLFILPNSVEISANYSDDGTWWAEYTFDEYTDYEVNASYAGLDDVTVNKGTISISKIPTEITVENDTVNLTVRDSIDAGAALSPAEAGNLTFTSSDDSIAKVEDGRIMAVGEGTAVITVSFGGRENYAAALSKTITVNIKRVNTTVAIENVTAPPGETITIYVSMTADDNLPFNGNATVTKPDGSQSLVSIIDGKGNTTWTVPETYVKGNYSTLVAYEGDDRYNSSDATGKIEVIQYNSKVTIQPISDVEYGKNVTVSYSVENRTTVSVKIEGISDDKIIITDDAITVVGLGAGKYAITIINNGNNIYDASNDTQTFTVSKVATRIAATGVSATYNVAKDMVITLTDSEGKALSGVKVTVNLGSEKKYTTDKDGKIKVAVGSLVPKAYIAKISFAGNDNYLASSSSAKVTVKKATPKITAKAKTFKYEDKTKKYTITLKDNMGKVMKNTKVTLKVNGKTYTAKTNSKGVATFKLSKLSKKGKYNAVITSAGNKYYKKATKKAKITVKAPAWKTVAKGSKDKATVKKIQRALKNNGYYLTYKGHYLKIDGIYKGCTERSVQQFQKAKGLKVTGKVDYATAKKLKIV